MLVNNKILFKVDEFKDEFDSISKYNKMSKT